jgi:crotonobetainyl-CoA:carnitine CoA-transferase CaiB-like acyl-CoA transferase
VPGHDTTEILHGLGYDDERIAKLLATGAAALSD